jgi:UDP-N-acetylglucosamine/UDP-N-acetylgalactosamine diphosphorylase
MEGPGTCAMAPDGNGGIYPAMKRCGIIQNMKQRGILYIHAFSVDNCLVKPADPVFLGYCIRQKADCGNKVLWKSHAHEKVGVMAEKDGKPCIVEYSELSETMAERTDPITGKLIFGAANICNHFYTLDFLETQVLPNMKNMYHMAWKKIPVWDDLLQQVVTPDKNNGIKLESFIFDVFPLSTQMAVMEVAREDEFAPIKNAPGSDSDSPEIARRMISDRAKMWLTRAGAQLIGDVESDQCEISPLTSYGGEDLETFKNRQVECPFQV